MSDKDNYLLQVCAE